MQMEEPEQRKWAWKSSLGLLLLGFVVIGFSLAASHFKAVAQGLSVEQANSQNNAWEAWVDIQMPDSLTYRAQRGWEMVASVSGAPVSESQYNLQRSKLRCEASHYAWNKSYSQRAVTTLFKSFGYLEQAIKTNDQDQREDLYRQLDTLEKTVETWLQTDLSATQKDSLLRLQSQLDVLRQQI